MRSGNDYDANVSAALFDFNNKKNTYNWNGKVALSKLIGENINNGTGYSHALEFGKTVAASISKLNMKWWIQITILQTWAFYHHKLYRK
jgi:hypothetical protein